MFLASARGTAKKLFQIPFESAGLERSVQVGRVIPSFPSAPSSLAVDACDRKNLRAPNDWVVCHQSHGSSNRKPPINEKVDSVLDGVFRRALPLPHSLPGVTPYDTWDNVFWKEDHEEYSNSQQQGTNREVIQAMNRNARRPKKANKGARPCSRVSRRQKKEKIGKRSR